MHCYLIYLHYYGSAWPEDDFFKSKLVASKNIDNKLTCFRLILILSNLVKEPCNSVEMRRRFERTYTLHLQEFPAKRSYYTALLKRNPDLSY